MTRRFLVVARVGDSSLHEGWFGPQRTFDLAIDYYGGTPGRYADSCDFYHANRGGKWPGIEALLVANPGYAQDYEAVWFPDDDLSTDASTVSAAFALHSELGLGLSQPALTEDSYFSHAVSLRHRGFTVRFTNFVECMAPIFSRRALTLCRPTFAESLTGWGLDLAWSSILDGAGEDLAVLDCAAVRHTRPVGGGDLYKTLGVDPGIELLRLSGRYGMPIPHGFRTYSGLDEEFRALDELTCLQRAGQNPPSPTVQDFLDADPYPRDVLTGSSPLTRAR